MKTFCVLGFVVVICTTMAAICPLGWQRYGESCYRAVAKLMDWHKASSICTASQADLAVPNSLREQAFVLKLSQLVFPPGHEGIWIDCHDLDHDGQWQNCPLRDDETDTYQNWVGGRPSNHIGSDCGLMLENGEWGNQRCTNPRYAMCELPVVNSNPKRCLQISGEGHIIAPCLVGHVMKELPAKGIMRCSKACQAEPQCRSINLLDQGRGKALCQLNNATQQEASVGYVKKIKNCYEIDL